MYRGHRKAVFAGSNSCLRRGSSRLALSAPVLRHHAVRLGGQRTGGRHILRRPHQWLHILLVVCHPKATNSKRMFDAASREHTDPIAAALSPPLPTIPCAVCAAGRRGRPHDPGYYTRIAVRGILSYGSKWLTGSFKVVNPTPHATCSKMGAGGKAAARVPGERATPPPGYVVSSLPPSPARRVEGARIPVCDQPRV